MKRSLKTEILVELRNVRKVFGKIVALDNVNFLVKKGWIHGVLGENGAGKTSLMNILYGLYAPDGGEIILNGKEVKMGSPHGFIKLGIGMVHQLSTLVPEFTALENIILGTQGKKYSLQLEKERGKIAKIASDYGLPFPFDVKIKELPAGIKQKIEIVRAIYKEANLLILDEPTTSLVESEFQQLLKSLHALVEKGMTIIFITHKIREIMVACDTVTVMRRGKVQGILDKAEMDKDKLVKLMFIEQDIKITESALPEVELPPCERSENPIVFVEDICVEGGEKSPGLRNVSFEIYGGEILGVVSVSGNGEKEIAEVMVNPSRLKSGNITINGSRVNGLTVSHVFAKGVFYTPEDRIKEGILPDASIKENLLLGHHTEERFIKNRIFINWDEAKIAAREVVENYNIHTPTEELEIKRLSGGNIQKVIIGRALLSPINFLVTHNPTSGLDISSVEFIFEKLVETRNNGGAVLWVNEDLDELMIISDRIAVLRKGELKGIFKRNEFDKYKIGLFMIGA